MKNTESHRDRRICVRLRASEADAALHAAQLTDQNLSDFVRTVVLIFSAKIIAASGQSADGRNSVLSRRFSLLLDGHST